MKSNVNRQAENTLADLQSRHVAANLLSELLCEHTPLDVCVARSQSYVGLSDQNKAFCLRLMQEYLRHHGQSEQAIAAFLRKPIDKNLIYVHVQIGLAMTQVASMNIPAYAAVNSAVELTKRAFEHHTGVVNAVLNKWVREHGGKWQADAISNIPFWLQERWKTMYGADALAGIAQALISEPPLDITFKEADGCKKWLKNATDTSAQMIGESLRLIYPGRVSELPGYAEGDWWVQDAAATLPVLLMGDVRGKNVLDMCAAPGGKTMQLAARGAKVTALDSSKKRMEIVRENLARTKLDAELIVIDALKYKPGTAPDAILLDAPCSATGTLRRNPDVLLHRSLNNLSEQVGKQRDLLNHAADIIPHGGILVYAVCSLEPEEGEMQIERLLNTRPDIIVDIEKIALPIELQASKFGLRTLPGMFSELGGMDGFFMTRLRRV